MINIPIENIAEIERENKKNKESLFTFTKQLKKELEKYSCRELMV